MFNLNTNFCRNLFFFVLSPDRIIVYFMSLHLTYYLYQLEDDVVTKPGYLSAIRSFALSQESNEWVLLEFSSLGFIGELITSSNVTLKVALT